jgi:2-keto-4-pentenoate hydratase/2-oxohepta-3-ene-1,7-dioic acid hydratase in catechol pathway
LTVFHIGTFADGGDAFPGLVVGTTVTDLRPHLSDTATVLSLLQDWDESLERLRALAADGPAGIPIEVLRVLPPVYPPGAYLCSSGNYRRHVLQMMVAAREPGTPEEEALERAQRSIDERAGSGIPHTFIGLPNAICGAYDDVILPAEGEQNDWELELAVIIGTRARAVSKADAMRHVAGYTISNDISARDRMYRKDIVFTDFLATKFRPTFKPTGPYITPADFVGDPHDLRIRLTLNGETMQDESTDDMIFRIERLIEYVSGMTDLNPGDMILTGSPAGNAAHHGNRFLRPGDVMEGEITGLGVQRNRCVAATDVAKGPDDAGVYESFSGRR